MSSSDPVVPRPEAAFYLSRNGEIFGPHSEEELSSFLEAGVISPDDLFWTEDMEQWMTIAEAMDRPVPVENGASDSAAEPPLEIGASVPIWASLPPDGLPLRLSIGMATALFVHLSLLITLTLGAPFIFHLKADPPAVAAPEPAPLEVAMVEEPPDSPPPESAQPPPPAPPPPDDPPPPPAVPDLPLPTDNLPPVTLPMNIPQPVIVPPNPVFAPIAPLASPRPKPVWAHRAQRAAAPRVATAPVNAGPSDYLYAPPPSYPYSARQMHQQGTVVLLVSIDDAGVPLSVSIDQSSGYSILDKVAQKAVQTYRFRVGDSRQLRVPITFVEN